MRRRGRVVETKLGFEACIERHLGLARAGIGGPGAHLATGENEQGQHGYDQ